jgi:nitroreductase
LETDLYPPSRLEDAADRIRERRSVRAADILEPGPSETEINELLEIASRVPDHGKLGPWRFLIFDGNSRQKFGELLRKQFAKTNPDSNEAILEREYTRFMRAPTIIGVISKVDPASRIPEWEQVLSSGAVCQNLLVGASLMGFAAQWLTEWYAYDEVIAKSLGLTENERVSGFIYIGSAREKPTERGRPDLKSRISKWCPA